MNSKQTKITLTSNAQFMKRSFDANKQSMNRVIPNNKNALIRPILNPIAMSSLIRVINRIEMMMLKSDTNRLKLVRKPNKNAESVLTININIPA
jgi:hypothetical protein